MSSLQAVKTLNRKSIFNRQLRGGQVTLNDPAVVSQNVINQSFLVCAKSEKYASLVTSRLLGSMR